MYHAPSHKMENKAAILPMVGLIYLDPIKNQNATIL